MTNKLLWAGAGVMALGMVLLVIRMLAFQIARHYQDTT